MTANEFLVVLEIQKQICVRALSLFGPNGENWVKDAYARNKENQNVDPEHPSAVCWCLTGAILKSFEEFEKLPEKSEEALMDLVLNNCNTGSLEDFNDAYDTEFENIRAVLESSIHSLEIIIAGLPLT